MADYYALTSVPLPAGLHGADAGLSIRLLTERERLAIEDYFLSRDGKVSLDPGATAVIVPHSEAADVSLEDLAILVEFAVGVLSLTGFQPVAVVAAISGNRCGEALERSYREVAAPPTFPRKLVKSAASTWLRYFFAARRKTRDRLRITADRFVRYLRMNDSRDALVDLCICLESLIESQTEISFKFSMCLAKVAAHKDAEATSDLLANLYDLRSKVVHGVDPTKEHRRVEPNTRELRLAARAILTAYILYIAEHGKEEWKKHLRRCLFT